MVEKALWLWRAYLRVIDSLLIEPKDTLLKAELSD